MVGMGGQAISLNKTAIFLATIIDDQAFKAVLSLLN
jgi:hypothetical protein